MYCSARSFFSATPVPRDVTTVLMFVVSALGTLICALLPGGGVGMFCGRTPYCCSAGVLMQRVAVPKRTQA